MFHLYSELELIEPVKLEITLNNGASYHLKGNYTVNAERLASLGADALLRLNEAGVLSSAFFVVASLNNVQKLIAIKNQRL